MKSNAELRLFAVPLCGGLIYAVTKGLVNGWNASQLFSGFVYGSVIAIVLGIPLLLWGDRRCPALPGRHFFSSLVQALAAAVLLGAATRHLLLAVLGGLALGGLFTLLVRGIEALPVAGEGPERQGWSRVLMVPLSGALTLGSIATALYPKGVESLPMFFFGGLIGAWLSVLVCWPMLWLVERVLVTPWRYVIGGGLSGLVVWLLSGAQGLMVNPQGWSAGLGFWVPLLTHGFFPFLLIGLLSGMLMTACNRMLQREKAGPG